MEMPNLPSASVTPLPEGKMVKYGTPGGRASRVADWSQKPRTESGLPANQSHEDEGMAAEPTQPEGNEKEVGKRGAVYRPNLSPAGIGDGPRKSIT